MLIRLDKLIWEVKKTINEIVMKIKCCCRLTQSTCIALHPFLDLAFFLFMIFCWYWIHDNLGLNASKKTQKIIWRKAFFSESNVYLTQYHTILFCLIFDQMTSYYWHYVLYLVWIISSKKTYVIWTLRIRPLNYVHIFLITLSENVSDTIEI